MSREECKAQFDHSTVNKKNKKVRLIILIPNNFDFNYLQHDVLVTFLKDRK